MANLSEVLTIGGSLASVVAIAFFGPGIDTSSSLGRRQHARTLFFARREKSRTRTGRHVKAVVVDDSGFQVHVTLWGDDATTFGAPVGSVVAFKGIRVSSYGERSLSLPDLGLIFVNPNTPQAVALRAWYNSCDLQDTFQSYGSSVDSIKDSSAQLMTIAQINSDVIAAKSTGKCFYLSATIASISLKDFDKPLHLSTNCIKHTWPEPVYYYNFSLQASNGMDTIRVQCTDPVGNELFHATANEMVKLQCADKVAFDRRIDRAISKKCTFSCKACTVDFSGGLTFILAIDASLDA
ncbi:Replication factor A protein 1 [Coemansia sp. RSA 2424]|nr:Replication factor A protein 1 [Coemansia sp. RSA 2424]